MSDRRDQLAEQQRKAALRVLHAVTVLEAAASGPTPELAVPRVWDAVALLDEDQVRGAAVVLALDAVWMPPGQAVPPRTADEIRARLLGVRRWLARRRLEAEWVAS